MFRPGQGQGKVERTRLFRVGKADRGKPSIGRLLLRDRDDPAVVGEGAYPIEDPAPYAMQWGVDDLEVRNLGVGPRFIDLGPIALEDLLGHPNHQLGVPGEDVFDPWHLICEADSLDGGGDVRVNRRDDLRRIGSIDLVSVVGRRVVTRRDHDRCRRRKVLRRVSH